ncbi:uncharacterized protein LOC123876178 isoform X3 [Maniola jurtina]|uniref:uncharacterized protein LOC123876178 isoform X3 n=1 Tax=Maniola jurtina TaxID=191418 RepID=UPI001E68C4B5|nr:uncharacterized protein LOC123876178 isoform X3 [Maniola jurtina]
MAMDIMVMAHMAMHDMGTDLVDAHMVHTTTASMDVLDATDLIGKLVPSAHEVSTHGTASDILTDQEDQVILTDQEYQVILIDQDKVSLEEVIPVTAEVDVLEEEDTKSRRVLKSRHSCSEVL